MTYHRTLPTVKDVTEARARIGPHIHRTPVMTSGTIDAMTGASVFFKPENLQKVGAFKARGATNAVLAMSEEEARRGVVTQSSGNHGQAVAFACALRGIPATVVMPDHAPSVKVEAVKGYGATVVPVPSRERERAVARIVETEGLTVVHPFDDPLVIAGQGTAAAELLEDVSDLDMLLTPIGGGGLLSGTTLVAESYGIPALGAEPELVDDAFRSLRDGERYPETGHVSIADGLLTGIGELAFELLSSAGTQILLVSEEEILQAARVFASRMKLVVEPSGATVLAAMLRHREVFTSKRVGVVISGGNMPIELLGSERTSDHG